MYSEPPDIDAMLTAGMPLWAAFALWVEMLYVTHVPPDVWWDELMGEPRPPERLQ
jgi:hypothetical protein